MDGPARIICGLLCFYNMYIFKNHHAQTHFSMCASVYLCIQLSLYPSPKQKKVSLEVVPVTSIIIDVVMFFSCTLT